MSSSTSSSSSLDAATPSAWRRWLHILLAVALGGTALVYVSVILIDPFATGRLTPFAHFSVTSDKRIFANAGRVRNPVFDAAIIGNSRSFAIEPQRLSEGTGRRFAHLGLEAVFHDDQLTMLAVFARARAQRAPAFVQVVDAENWCNPSRGRTGYDVPWWLYEGSTLTYLQRILSVESLRASWRRVRIALGIAGDAVRRDGYSVWLPRNATQLRQAMVSAPQPASAGPADAPFAELDDLERALKRLEPESPVVLLMPPVFAKALPVKGSPADARLAACKHRLEAIAAARPNTAFVDARRDGPAVREPNNFIDATHYLDPVAIPTEAEVIAALKKLIR
jgi:hypothetical protein